MERTRAISALLVLLLALRAVAAVVSSDGRYWDFTNFYNTGARVFHREFAGLYAPDGVIAGRPALGDPRMPMVYTGFPLTALELAPIGWLEPERALHAFKLLCLGCYALALALLFPAFRARLGANADARLALPLYLALALTFEPIWFTLR